MAQQVPTTPQLGRVHSIPVSILDDLASRFIINAPEEEKRDLTRMCFQIELAYWFYTDEYVQQDNYNPGGSKLKSCTLREFAEHMFKHVSFLKSHAKKLDGILETWKEYKMQVPTYGAIILDEDLSHVLLVQGFWSKSSWGFPKGKVNEEELPHICAAREVLEETGFDISNRLDEASYLQTVINDQTVQLYLISGVPKSTNFAPKTKNEIRSVRWFPVQDLPSSKKEAVGPGTPNLTHNNLYMVIPFIKSLKKWIGLQHGFQSQSKKKSSQSKKPQKPKDHSYVEDQIMNQDCPKCWSKFHFKKKDIVSALTSSPNWIQ